MVTFRVARTTELTDTEREAILPLLLDAFGDRFSDDDWNHSLGGWHVLASDRALVAHAAVVTRIIEVGPRTLRAGYVEGVATATRRQGQGLGAAVMARINAIIDAEHELGALSTGSHEFYERLGWERWQGPSYVRDGDIVVRTPEEDDGIMVRRVGPSAGLALTLPITCGTRPGDAW